LSSGKEIHSFSFSDYEALVARNFWSFVFLFTAISFLPFLFLIGENWSIRFNPSSINQLACIFLLLYVGHQIYKSEGQSTYKDSLLTFIAFTVFLYLPGILREVIIHYKNDYFIIPLYLFNFGSISLVRFFYKFPVNSYKKEKNLVTKILFMAAILLNLLIYYKLFSEEPQFSYTIMNLDNFSANNIGDFYFLIPSVAGFQICLRKFLNYRRQKKRKDAAFHNLVISSLLMILGIMVNLESSGFWSVIVSNSTNLLAILLFFGFVNYSRERTRLIARISSFSLFLVFFLAILFGNIYSNLFSRNWDQSLHILHYMNIDSAREDTSLEFLIDKGLVHIRKIDGTILYENKYHRIPPIENTKRFLRNETEIPLEKVEYGNRYYFFQDKNLYHIYYFNVAGETIEAWFDGELFRIEYGYLFFGLLGILTIYLLIFFATFPVFFRRDLVDPLNDLLEAIQKMNSGNMTYKAKVWKNDEIGFIAKSFNKMQRKILDGINNLEEKVRKRTEDLEKAKNEAIKAGKAKADFLATMSHEIRTPMNSVIGITDLLLMDNPKPEHKVYLDNLKFAGENLLSIINDILDYSKIEAGSIRLESIPIPVYSHFRNIFQLAKFKADERGIKLNFVGNSAENIIIYSDPTRLAQITNNLLSNALKFTETGEVTLHVSIGSLRETGDLQIEVSDTGIGISETELNKIFNEFHQAEMSTTRKYGGTGLGLAITSRLVKLMNGNIKVESKLGVGSKFSVVLPVRVSHQDSFHPESKEKSKYFLLSGNVLKGFKILVVDDNQMNLFVAKKFLEKWGAEVFVAISGYEAIDLVQKMKIDLILMDIQMPEMDGIETTKQIKSLNGGAFAQIPVFSLSASVGAETAQRARSVGICENITKPFLPEDLYRRIYEYLIGSK